MDPLRRCGGGTVLEGGCPDAPTRTGSLSYSPCSLCYSPSSLSYSPSSLSYSPSGSLSYSLNCMSVHWASSGDQHRTEVVEQEGLRRRDSTLRATGCSLYLCGRSSYDLGSSAALALESLWLLA